MFLKSGTGTGFIPGWYQITGGSGNNATLNGTIGQAISTSYQKNTSAGCGAATVTSISWAIDYTQQSSAVISPTVSSSSTTVTATTSVFTPAMIGNCITDGTNYKEITAVTTGTGTQTTCTIDSALGTAWSSTSVTIGGAANVPNTVASPMVAQNRVWVKYYSSAYSQSSAFSPTVSGGSSSNCFLSGYNTLRGDNPTGTNRPTITASASMTAVISGSFPQWTFENLIINANSQTTTSCINLTATNWDGSCRNCKLENFTAYGITTGRYGAIYNTEITYSGNTVTAGMNSAGSPSMVFFNYVHDMVGPGMLIGGDTAIVIGNIVANCSGSASDGINTSGVGLFLNNTVYNCGRDGIRNTVSSGPGGGIFQRNLLVSNGGYGLNFSGSSSTLTANPDWDNNAYYGNTSGTRNNCGTGLYDTLLSANPFVNTSAGNYALNNIVGGGLSCAVAGLPGNFAGGLVISYPSLGAIQPPPPTSVILMPLYGSNNNSLTFSGLGTLGSGSNVFSSAVNNTVTLNLDDLVSGSFTTAASGVSGSGTIIIVVAASSDGGTTYSTLVANCKLVGIVTANATSTTYVLDPTSIASLYGGQLPPYFKIGVINNTGAALTAGTMMYQMVQTQGIY